MLLNKFYEPENHQPLLNYFSSLIAGTSDLFNDYQQIDRKKRVMRLVLRSPEAMMVVRGVANDIAGSYHFEPVNVRETGRNKILKAEEFARKVKYNKLRKNTIQDGIITGEGYNFLNIPLMDEATRNAAETLKEEYRMMGMERKAELVDETMSKPTAVQYVPSTTMVTRFDRYSVIGYAQRVNDNQIDYDLQSIIKYTFEEVDGKVEGFTPFLSLPLHLELLWLMWQNQYYFQAKGNHPDLVVSMEGMDPNSPSYLKIQQELAAYNKPGSSSHGTMLLSGMGTKFNIVQLERADSLQFKEVNDYIATLIANQWQYPVGRLGIKTQQATNAKDSAGSSERSYWNFIARMQTLYCEIENSQLWEPYFGVRLCPDQSYLHDEVVENTGEQLRLGNLQTKITMLQASGKSLTDVALVNMINGRDLVFDEDDLIAAPMQVTTSTGIDGKNQLTKQQVSGQGMSNSDRAQKRGDEISREQNTSKPTGVG